MVTKVKSYPGADCGGNYDRVPVVTGEGENIKNPNRRIKKRLEHTHKGTTKNIRISARIEKKILSFRGKAAE